VELPLDEVGRLRLDELEAELAPRCGIRRPRDDALGEQRGRHDPAGREVARLTARAGVPLHVDAIAAYGQVPIDFHAVRRATDAAAGTGLVALSVSAHKIGGPAGDRAHSCSTGRRASSRSSTAGDSSAASAPAPRTSRRRRRSRRRHPRCTRSSTTTPCGCPRCATG
jgi:hypothetical protein